MRHNTYQCSVSYFRSPKPNGCLKDDESIERRFRNKCADIIRENLLQIPSGNFKQGPNMCPKDMPDAGRQDPKQISREYCNQQECYSSPDLARDELSVFKKSKREMIIEHHLHEMARASGKNYLFSSEKETIMSDMQK